ncbi:salivary gland metalloprotease, putative [Ixodes scapularis]|uniref:Salivary gland metalloprotease, putative n=1 Tax=Ixodes scapularis TaxID=6945 RepID=B7QM90_IXOSC|nr:salivary gland metalloprotease, putative [Ixodes scapularis]|eukprot:XP_002416295.1 salivary gland metalloprotease, putative [Ixodes scapularis]
MSGLSLKLWTAAFFAFCLAEKEHGIVYPRMLESRAATGERMLKINADLTLTLQKSKVFADDFLFSTTDGNEPIDYYIKAEDAERDIYHDSTHMASVRVTDDDGVEVEGILGERLRVKPLPAMARTSDGLRPHMLYEVDAHENGRPHDYGKFSDPSTRMSKTGSSTTSVYKIPLEEYPSLYQMIDERKVSALRQNVLHIKAYFAVIKANLRYASFVFPKVQLRITGITMNKKVSVNPAFSKLYEHPIRHEFSEAPYSVLLCIRITPLLLSTCCFILFYTLKNIVIASIYLNFQWYAYLGTACSEWKVGMSEDRPTSYYGAYVFAHELGHNLGCQHDGDGPSDWVKGHIGSADCPWDDGYLMSYKMQDQRQYQFSYCCQREVRNLYNRPEFKCLRERYTTKTIKRSSKLPGRMTTLSNYCQRVYMYDEGMHADPVSELP